MKKILALTAGMLLVASLAFARDIDTGTIELAGSSNGFFTSTWGNGDTVTALKLDVKGIYYLMPNFGIGGLFGGTLSGGDGDGSRFTIGPEVIYNYSIDEDVNAYVEVNLWYLSDDDGITSSEGLFLGLGGGIKYFFTDSASLNCGLSYSNDFGDFDRSSFGVNVGLSIFLK